MHLFLCPDATVRELLDAGLAELEDAIRLRHVPSAMWTTLKVGIRSYCYDRPVDKNTIDTAYLSAFNAQSRIGWDNLMKDFVAVEWG